MTKSTNEIERRFVNAVDTSLRTNIPDKQLRCVFIQYSYGHWNFPVIRYATTLEMQDVVRTDDSEPESVGRQFRHRKYWQPDQYSQWFKIDEPDLRTQWDQHIESLTTQEDYDDCVAMLRRVAMTLNDVDWREVFPISKSFVIVARDTELQCAITDDLEGSVPADKLLKLRNRGLAP